MERYLEVVEYVEVVAAEPGVGAAVVVVVAVVGRIVGIVDQCERVGGGVRRRGRLVEVERAERVEEVDVLVGELEAALDDARHRDQLAIALDNELLLLLEFGEQLVLLLRLLMCLVLFVRIKRLLLLLNRLLLLLLLCTLLFSWWLCLLLLLIGLLLVFLLRWRLLLLIAAVAGHHLVHLEQTADGRERERFRVLAHLASARPGRRLFLFVRIEQLHLLDLMLLQLLLLLLRLRLRGLLEVVVADKVLVDLRVDGLLVLLEVDG